MTKAIHSANNKDNNGLRQLILNLDTIENSITALRDLSQANGLDAYSLHSFLKLVDNLVENTFSDVSDHLRSIDNSDSLRTDSANDVAGEAALAYAASLGNR